MNKRNLELKSYIEAAVTAIRTGSDDELELFSNYFSRSQEKVGVLIKFTLFQLMNICFSFL